MEIFDLAIDFVLMMMMIMINFLDFLFIPNPNKLK